MLFLKKHFPNFPNWLLGGLFLVSILWLIVLPVEVIEALLKQDFSRPNLYVWIVRSFYIFGYGTSLSLISPWTNAFITIDKLRFVVVLLGLLISSPAYFAIGALLETKKAVLVNLGIVLALIKMLTGCFAILAILISD